MTIGELAIVMADIVVDKSDPLNTNFNKIFHNLPDEKYVRRELMYFKAFLVSFRAFAVSNSSNIDEANVATKLMVEKLEEYFDSNDYGCNPNVLELITAMTFYRNIFIEKYYDVLKQKHKLSSKELEFKLFRLFTASGFNFFKFLNNKSIYDSSYIVNSSLFFDYIRGTYKQIKDVLEEKTCPNSGSCFVATATYGDAFHPDVVYLRYYRDKYLSRSVYGRTFIKFYYCVGPYLSLLPKHFFAIKKISRKIIEKIVIVLKQKYD